MRMSAAVMHVPDSAVRRAMLSGLLIRMGQDVVRDRLDGFTVVKDAKREGVWPTARKAWLSAAGSATHHLVIQDDAILCLDFIIGVERLVECAPESPILMYDMTKATTEALSKGTNWIVRSSMSTALAVVMPVDMAIAAIKWADANVVPSLVHDDVRFSMYFQDHKIPILSTAPSLVDHGGDESLVGNPRYLPGRRERKARKFIGATVSATSIDWAATVSRPYRAPSHPPSEYAQYRR